jgi:hypothetical protein
VLQALAMLKELAEKHGYLYQIALPATHLRRCGGLVTAVQAFDLTHVFDVIIPAQSQAT